MFNKGTKTWLFLISIAWITLSMACQTITPLPDDITAPPDSEFTLASGQTATIINTGLTIKFIGVRGDERCPSEIECAISGPVSISLSVQAGDGTLTDLNLQTFTDIYGLAPEIQFEGINSQAIYEGYVIRIVGVLPYPVKSFNEIKDSGYRVTLVVTEK